MSGHTQRLSRRELLVRMGIATVGTSGFIFTLRHGAQIGAVVPRASAAGKGPDAARVDIGPPMPSGVGFVAAYVVTRGNAAALIDAGLPHSADPALEAAGLKGTAAAIEDVLEATGADWSRVRHVILTHYHNDHSGSAAEVLRRAPRAALWVGPADIPLLEEAVFPAPPEEGADLRRTARPAEDGAEILGLRVVATPGHTPGHISLLDAELGTLFVGDTVYNGPLDLSVLVPGAPVLNAGGGLGPAEPPFTADSETNIASIERLGRLAFARALFGHGPPLEGDAPAAFRVLAARLRG